MGPIATRSISDVEGFLIVIFPHTNDELRWNVSFAFATPKLFLVL